MKIRQPWMLQLLCLIGFWLLRGLVLTTAYKYWHNGRDLRPSLQARHKNYIYVVWHEYVLMPVICFSHASIRMLASKHADGLIAAEISKHRRMGVVRGSSTRGGVEALRRLLMPGRYRHLAITPDGPRGPRRHVQLGIIYLASKLGWPIIAVGVGHDRPWRLRNWDRMAIPKPFHRSILLASDPIDVPANLDRSDLEAYRCKVESILNEITALAELTAETGQNPFRQAKIEQPKVANAA